MSMLVSLSAQLVTNPVSARFPCLMVSCVTLLLTSCVLPAPSEMVKGPATAQDSTKVCVVPVRTWSRLRSNPANLADASKSSINASMSTSVALCMSLSKCDQS